MDKRRVLAFVAAVTLSSSAFSQVNIRVGHFAPFADDVAATAVDVSVNGNVILEDVEFGTFSDPIDAGAAGTFDVEITPNGAADPAITASLELTDGDYLAIAIGNGGNQPLSLIAVGEDNSAPAAGNVKLRVIHAAPFAANEADTQVDIRTAGGDVVAGLESVGYAAVSDYFEVPEGTYDLKITGVGGAPNFIDPLPVALGEGSIATLIATGDGTNQPLGVTAIPLGALTTRAPVDFTGTGLFYDPAQDGQGINLLAQPSQNRILGYYYGYNEAGTEQKWYIFDSCQTPTGETGCAVPGAFDGVTAEVIIKEVTGGVFNAGDTVTRADVGSGTITFTGCDAVTFVGDFGTADGDITFDYTRLGDRVDCSADLQQ